MNINKELMKGSTVILVLTLLNRKAMYGYQVIKEIEVISTGTFQLKEGTLYPILHTLEAEGYVESFWEGEDGTRQRKYYRITSTGMRLLKQKRDEWVEFRSAVDRIVLDTTPQGEME